MKRKAEKKLLIWKDSPSRKPLLVTGARQVGKTWLMKKFGSNSFENMLYVNFEKEIPLRTLFEQDYQPTRIVKVLETYFNQSVISGKTLLIFDEIQEAKGAITSLKYFREELPEQHLIGAGSLLGIAMKNQTSFPVGQVEFLNLCPMDFDEFLRATENQRLAELIFQNDWQLLENLKTKVIELLKTYFYVGGMPEAVLTYSINQNLQEVRSIQDSILQAYEQDFSKHAPPEIIPRIRMIWNGLVGQLSKENKKFVYGLIREGARAKDFEMAINWLSDYGLIHLVHRTKKANFPLAAYSDLQAFKIYALDVGLLAAMGNINSRTLIEKEQLFTEFKGALTEQFVLQEFKSEGMKQIYYWANDTGSAEVDFLLEFENKILPIEVKASENLQSKSLKTFSSKYPDIHCFRKSLSNFRNENWMTNIPLFGVKQLLNN